MIDVGEPLRDRLASELALLPPLTAIIKAEELGEHVESSDFSPRGLRGGQTDSKHCPNSHVPGVWWWCKVTQHGIRIKTLWPLIFRRSTKHWPLNHLARQQ